MLKRVTNGVAEDGWGNTRQPLGDAIDAPARYRLFKKTIINHELAHHSFILIIYYFYYLSLITHHLPMELPTLCFDSVVNLLDKQNPHPRDKRITFYDEGHIYDVDGRRDFVSCTTFIHTFYKEFDADYVIQRLMSNHTRWSKSVYYGQTADEIKTLWKNKGELASHKGTILHACIEYFYNNCVDAFPYDIPPEYTTDFHNFHQKVVCSNGYTPYRTEWCVFDEEHELAGSIDMLFQVDKDDPDGLLIYDWKRSCKLREKTNRFQNMLHPIDHLPDTNYWHYVMQLNIYRHILETKYNKKILGMYLVGIHPDLSGFQQEKVPFLHTETEALFAERKKHLHPTPTLT